MVTKNEDSTPLTLNAVTRHHPELVTSISLLIHVVAYKGQCDEQLLGSGSDKSIYWIFTSRNCNLLLHFQGSCIYDMPTIITLSRLLYLQHIKWTLQLLNCLERRLPDESSVQKVKVTLRLTVSQSVSLGVEPHLGIMTRYLILFDSYGLAFVVRALWQEDGSVFCICCWSSPT
jgi:hypothetical protein